MVVEKFFLHCTHERKDKQGWRIILSTVHVREGWKMEESGERKISRRKEPHRRMWFFER